MCQFLPGTEVETKLYFLDFSAIYIQTYRGVLAPNSIELTERCKKSLVHLSLGKLTDFPSQHLFWLVHGSISKAQKTNILMDL